MRNKRFAYISEKGFTLIELMLVLAVIGILAVVTVPQYRAITDHYYLQSSANILADELRNAKQLAMDRRENMAVGVSGAGVQIYRLVLPQGGQAQFTPFDQLRDFDSEVQCSAGTNTWPGQAPVLAYIYFDYRGFSQTNPPGSAAAFTLSSLRTTNAVKVNVEAGTGNVAISWP